MADAGNLHTYHEDFEREQLLARAEAAEKERDDYKARFEEADRLYEEAENAGQAADQRLARVREFVETHTLWLGERRAKRLLSILDSEEK